MIKHVKNQSKQCETGCFQSRVTDYMSTKMRTETNYQIPHRQNSYLYLSLFAFTGLKLSNDMMLIVANNCDDDECAT